MEINDARERVDAATDHRDCSRAQSRGQKKRKRKERRKGIKKKKGNKKDRKKGISSPAAMKKRRKKRKEHRSVVIKSAHECADAHSRVPLTFKYL